MFKRNSVWLVRGCGGEPGSMVCEVLDDARGCVGPAAFAQVGNAVWYASDDGIRKVEGGEASNVRALRVPVSAPVGDFWKSRVAWPAGVSPLASAAVFRTRVLFSVPLDGEELSALLVYSLAHGCWTGVWTGLTACGLVASQLRSGAGLKMVGPDCGLQRLLPALYRAEEWCPARLVSRAFDGGCPGRVKRFARAVAALVSAAATGAVADFRSVDLDLGATVTHLTDAPITGAVSKICVLGRVCRALSLDILFKAGTVRLRSLTVQSQPRGR